MSMIYYVEDDTSIRDAVVYALEATEFKAEGFEDGATLFTKLKSKIPDLILLDIMLPGEDGIHILKHLRSDQRTANIPVILITAKGSEFEKVIGLDSGADDYVAKPFGVMELISRIKAVLRRIPKKKDDEKIVIGNIAIDAYEYEVSVAGRKLELTLKEFDLLYCLMKNKGRVFSRNELLDLIWGYDSEGETRTVDVHIGTIRQKLGDFGTMIETVRGVGYKFTRNEG